MSRFTGLLIAGAMMMGVTTYAEAQFSVSIGNPYTGQGVYVGSPVIGSGYGYGYGSPAYGVNTISTGFGYPGYGYGGGYNNYYGSNLITRPGSFGYSSGYQGYGPGYSSGYQGYGPGYSGYTYGGRPYVRGFGNGGYGGFGNRPRPFLGFGRGFR